MKDKKNKIIIVLAILLFIFGCTLMGISIYNNFANNDESNVEENKNEQKETDADKITRYIKNNMISNWTYTSDKLKVNDDNSVEIIFNAVDDWTTCGYNANKSAVRITKNSDDILSKIPSITFICKDSNSNLVSKAVYTNISSINKDNVENNASFYDANNSQINNTVEKGYQSFCKNYSYKEIFRNPDDYLYKKIKITGEVIQVMEETEDGTDYWVLRVNMTKDDWGYYDDTVMVLVDKSIVKGRIIEDDIFIFYGQILEPTTYTTVLNSSQTVPTVLAYYAYLVK